DSNASPPKNKFQLCKGASGRLHRWLKIRSLRYTEASIFRKGTLNDAPRAATDRLAFAPYNALRLRVRALSHVTLDRKPRVATTRAAGWPNVCCRFANRRLANVKKPAPASASAR